jgi:hypothetical protein
MDKRTFEEKVRENPDSFDEYDCREPRDYKGGDKALMDEWDRKIAEMKKSGQKPAS